LGQKSLRGATCGLVGLALTAAASAANVSDVPAGTSASAPSIHGDVSVTLERAMAYEHGEGVPKDAKIAAALYCEAAVKGNAEAAFQLGWMYANGRGVARDDGTAAALFELAAGDGYAFAGTVLTHFEGVHGMLPDCMRPVAPPPLPDPVVVADAFDEPDPFDDLPAEKKKIVSVVNELAPEYGIEPRLALAVIAVESNFNASARSSKDAQGLMQLIPGTALRFNVRRPFDVLDNLRGGLSYLRWLLSYYKGEVALAAAAYNAGERVVDRYHGVPPYPETREYVRRVLDLFRRPLHPYDPTIAVPSAVARIVKSPD
jgi:hypothetical protein